MRFGGEQHTATVADRYGPIFEAGDHESGLRARSRKRSPSAVYARAVPEEVLVEEVYHYEQRISRNPLITAAGPSAGRIEIRMPYDGERYFTRDAADDVAPHLARRAAGPVPVEAQIGHLVAVDHQETDLSRALDLDSGCGAYPLRIVVGAPDLPDPHSLVQDDHEHRREIRFHPPATGPEILPVEVEINLSDPDHYDTPVSTSSILRFPPDQAPACLEKIADSIKQSVGFRPFLRLEIRTTVTLRGRTDRTATPPTVQRVGIALPRLTSLTESSLQLFVAGAHHDFQYNPANQCLEWFDVPTAVRKSSHSPGDPGDDSLRRFDSPPMVLHFIQPGQLFALEQITAQVDTEISGDLLSGTKIRLFDARGNLHRRPPLRLRSLVHTRCTVVLRDAFARRPVSPYQSFHFSEIIPSAMRIADVKAVLEDQRFEVVGEWPLDPLSEHDTPIPADTPAGSDPETPRKPRKRSEPRRLRHFIVAVRINGPDTLELWVLVEGRHRNTQREARQPGGHRYTSKLDSGDIDVFVRGQARGDARELVHEINQMQLALRERFHRLKAHR